MLEEGKRWLNLDDFSVDVKMLSRWIIHHKFNAIQSIDQSLVKWYRRETTKKYLDIGILVEKPNKGLHEMEQEINTTEQTLVVANLRPESPNLKDDNQFEKLSR